MSDAGEWGPWIEHDGRGCPVPKGTVGEAELRNRYIVSFRAGCGSTRGGPDRPSSPDKGSAWVWGNKPIKYWMDEVIRYRIRRPDALRELIRIAADPQPLPDLVPS